MTEADRIYQERARRERQAEEARVAAAERQHAEELRDLGNSITDLIPEVLQLLKSASYPGGQLIGIKRRTLLGGFKRDSVAAWYLYGITLPYKDTTADWMYWLSSSGRLIFSSFGGAGYMSVADEPHAKHLTGVLQGLQQLADNLRAGPGT